MQNRAPTSRAILEVHTTGGRGRVLGSRTSILTLPHARHPMTATRHSAVQRLRRFAKWILPAIAVAMLPGNSPATDHEHGAHDPHLPMSDAQMQREVDAWFARHPAHGGAMLGSAAADTFLVRNFAFDTDGSLASQVDTARIVVGESILFRWIAGSHTTTSGLPSDSDAGSLWDAPISNLSPSTREFSVMFGSAGTFPFFCRPHGAIFDMTGVVVVTESTVGAPPTQTGSIGFVGTLAPNPTQGGAAFRFALARAGRVRVELYDASGRRLASVLDRDLGPGLHADSWDGRVQGKRAAAGVYYLRLRMAEGTQTRRLVVER